MVARVHRPLKVIAFNANGLAKHRYDPSKQLQELHTDVACSLTHLKPHERFFIPSDHIGLIASQAGKRNCHCS
jgi:hypothetical protein